MEEDGEEEDSDQSSIDEEAERIEAMATEMDEDIKKRKEYQLANDKTAERRANKKQKILE